MNPEGVNMQVQKEKDQNKNVTYISTDVNDRVTLQLRKSYFMKIIKTICTRDWYVSNVNKKSQYVSKSGQNKNLKVTLG